MKINYHDFLRAVLGTEYECEDSYPIEILELRSMTTFGVNFSELLYRFLKECGFKNECCFLENKSKVYLSEFVQLNRKMIQKMYNTNALAMYNISSKTYVKYYVKLGQELMVEI